VRFGGEKKAACKGGFAAPARLIVLFSKEKFVR
jgi:hypothetical protein